MKVNTLLKTLQLKPVSYNHDVYKLASDSRQCVENAIFVAIDGNHINGELYIRDAIKNGAKTIVCEKCSTKIKNINYVFVNNVRKTLALMAKVFYQDISKKIKLIGVIGTNGKTTTSTIAYNFFEYLELSSMLIGTNGVFFKNYEANIDNTTPDILTIYQYLWLAKKKKIRYVFMEVSSIAVDQYRIYGLDFDCLIFTNFSQDHLDYHKTLDKYLYCKLIPFIKLKPEACAILNSDDPIYEKIEKFTDAKILSYGYNHNASFLGTMHSVSENGVAFYAKNLLFKSKLIGEFNLYNLLSILPLCKAFKIPYLRYVGFLTTFKPVSGRMNLIKYQDKNILLDYAHTFIATKEVVKEAQRLCNGNLYIILGCGGNREKEKRKMIGAFLDKVKANIILTTDNPRFEDPEMIAKDIKDAMQKDVEIILNRKEAIITTLNKLAKNDYLLVLGKGCEKYIDIRGVKHPYSDLEVIHDYIAGH